MRYSLYCSCLCIEISHNWEMSEKMHLSFPRQLQTFDCIVPIEKSRYTITHCIRGIEWCAFWLKYLLWLWCSHSRDKISYCDVCYSFIWSFFELRPLTNTVILMLFKWNEIYNSVDMIPVLLTSVNITHTLCGRTNDAKLLLKFNFRLSCNASIEWRKNDTGPKQNQNDKYS